MANYNRVTLMGNVTRDVEIRQTGGGTSVCDVGLAINESRRGKDGEWVQVTTFIDVTYYGKLAEAAVEKLRKGSAVLVDGRLRQETWQQNGQKRSKHIILGATLVCTDRAAKSDAPVLDDVRPDVASDAFESDIPF